MGSAAKRSPASPITEVSLTEGVVSDQLTTFFAHAESSGRTVPAFVERELSRYLECGILAYGFVRVRCAACRYDRVVAFSCKGRGFCPSCGGRRMAATAAFLVDCVIPTVPVRQWVLSLPIALRYKVAYDSQLAAEVLQIFVRSVFTSLRRRARSRYGRARYECGSVTERLSKLGDGRLLYRLKRRWRDGTTHVVFQPLELVEKLAAIVPPPRIHMIRYHGVLAPRAGCRREVVGSLKSNPAKVKGSDDGANDCAHTQRRWTPWAKLLQRVFAIDVLECPRCGGKMNILATIHPPEATAAILESLDLSPRAPPLAAPSLRAGGEDLF